MIAPRARRPAFRQFARTLCLGWLAILVLALFWHLILGAIPMIDLIALMLALAWIPAAAIGSFVSQ